MPADRPGRRPGSAPEDPYYGGDGEWAQDPWAQNRTDREGPRRAPDTRRAPGPVRAPDPGRGPSARRGPDPRRAHDPRQEEVHHLRAGEWARTRNDAGNHNGGPGPTQAERFYLAGGKRPGGGGARNQTQLTLLPNDLLT